MAWARLDDGFDEHAKTLALLELNRGIEAVGLWVLCLAYAHRSRRKGKVAGQLPPGLLRRYVGRDGAELAALLVEVGYWEASEGGGWQIVNFDKYLPTEKTSEARAIAGRKGAEKRWGVKPDGDSSEPSGDGKLPLPGYDGDGKPVANDGSRAAARARSHPHSLKDENQKTAPSRAPRTKQPRKDGPEGERAEAITKGFWDHTKGVCNYQAVYGVVLKVIKAGSSDLAIVAALKALDASGRPVTADTMRAQINGTAVNGRSRPATSSVGRTHQQ